MGVKKPEYHCQYNLETCGICCILMAQQAFGMDHATVAKQLAYYRDYGAKSTAGTLGSTIAYVLYMKGLGKDLNVKIVHASENFLENDGDDGPYFAPDKFEKILEEHKKWLNDAELFRRVKKRPEDSFTCLSGHPFDCGELRAELEKGRLVIVQVYIPGDDGEHEKVMHWILLWGMDGELFKAIDPMPKPVGGKIRLSPGELEEYMKTPFGGNYIAVWKNED